jgi:hypothetical protein
MGSSKRKREEAAAATAAPAAAAATAATTTTHTHTTTATTMTTDEEEDNSFARRYICRATYRCIVDHHCIPCLYKVFPKGEFYKYPKASSEKPFVAGAKHNVSLPPNQRPEQCAHAKRPQYSGLYAPNSGQRVLTVGDGDFSFSLALAQGLLSTSCGGNTSSSSAASTLVATSHESHASVLKVYPNCRDTLAALHSCNNNHSSSSSSSSTAPLTVHHDVDATALSLCEHLKGQRFDRVVWNFPCVSNSIYEVAAKFDVRVIM